MQRGVWWLLLVVTAVAAAFAPTAAAASTVGATSAAPAANGTTYDYDVVTLHYDVTRNLADDAVDPGRGSGEVRPAVGASGASVASSRELSAPEALGTASRFSINRRVVGQLDEARLGPLAGRFGPDDLQGLMHAPGARPFFDVSTGNINVIQEIDGVLFRITTVADDFRIISVGRLRPNQLRNGEPPWV